MAGGSQGWAELLARLLEEGKEEENGVLGCRDRVVADLPGDPAEKEQRPGCLWKALTFPCKWNNAPKL